MEAILTNRYTKVLACTLRTYPIGELHLGVELLSKERGLLSSIAYGARSQTGRLHGRVEQFSFAECTLYAKEGGVQMGKIHDYEVTHYFEPLRENLPMYCYASLWCECILRSFRGEEHTRKVFLLLKETLDTLLTCSREQMELLNVRFLWKYIDLLGMQPQLGTDGIYYHPRLCDLSQESRAGWKYMPPTTVNFLQDCNEHSSVHVIETKISQKHVKLAWYFLRNSIHAIIGRELNTLHATGAIIG